MRTFLKYLSIAVALLLPVFSAVHAEPLTVAVAANVRYAFDDLAAEFRKESGIEVRGVFASTGKITAQVKSGAPFDIFLSADTEFPELLYKEGLAVSQPRIYAYGVLVLWTQKDRDLSKGLAVLADPSIQKIAAPNPKVAPYGRAALQALQGQKLYAAVAPRLVYGESISQATQFIYSGAADIGFTAKSVVLSPEMKGKGKWMEIPGSSYDPIAQAVVVLKHGAQTHAGDVRKFMDFLFSRKARAIFEKYGYILP